MMEWTQKEIEDRMKEVERQNPYKHQFIYTYCTPWCDKRFTYELSKVGFDSFEAAQKDQIAMAKRHERLARLSMESGHDMVCI